MQAQQILKKMKQYCELVFKQVKTPVDLSFFFCPNLRLIILPNFIQRYNPMSINRKIRFQPFISDCSQVTE